MGNERAIALLEQALAELRGASAPASASPGYSAPPQGAPAGQSNKLSFGDYAGKTVAEVAALGDIKALSDIAARWGVRKDGSEDPKWAARNAAIRAEASGYVMRASQALAAPAAPLPAGLEGATPVDENEDIPF